MKNNIPWYFNLCVLLLILLSAPAYSVDDQFYYQLGGGEPITQQASNRAQTLQISNGISWNSNLMCGNFDISLSVQQQLNGLTGAFQNLMGNVINSATGFVASLPALIIQRVNPALYDLLQNGILQSSEEFHLAAASCEDMVAKIQGSSTNAWDTMAEADFWIRQSQSSSNEILQTKQNAATQGRSDGITWVGGLRAGGDNQPSVEIIGDTTEAGYNMLLNRPPATTTTTATTCNGAAICQVWPRPQDASSWLVDVVGEDIIQTCLNCNKRETRAGMGLNKKYEEERDRIEADLTLLVNATAPPTQPQLTNVSGGPGMRLSRRVVEAIRAERTEDQAPIIRRISGEMALNLTLERALLSRRMLLSGMKEPNVASAPGATTTLNLALKELNIEIDNILYEMEVRSKIARNTSAELLRRDQLRKKVPVVEHQSPLNLNDGAAN